MKFSMSDAWNEATAMMGANREVLLIVAGIFFFLPALALSFAMGDIQQLMRVDDTAAMQQALVDFYGSQWWLLLLGFMAQIVGYLALLALLRDAAQPTVGDAIKTGLKGLLPAIGVYLLIAVAFGLALGLLAAVAAGTGSVAVTGVISIIGVTALIAALVKTALAAPVIAIDKVYNPFKVLARSWRLTNGNGFRLLLFFLLIFIVYAVVSMVVGVILQALLFLLGDSVSVVLNGLLSGLLGAVVAVVLVAVLAAVHRQLAGPSAQAVSATFE